VRRGRWLDDDEQLLLAFLVNTLEERSGAPFEAA
jgi:hypothetical protein